MLVDSSSSLNFIQTRLARYLRLPIESVHRFFMAVGNGQKLFTDGCVKGVSLVVQEFEIITYLFVLPIEGADAILGISWLSTLGRIILDYKHLPMQFESDGHMVELRGEQSSLKGTVQLHFLRRLTITNGILGCFALTLTDNEFPTSVALPFDL